MRSQRSILVREVPYCSRRGDPCPHYEGRVPQDEQDLRTLEGVGDYVASAVLVFGFESAGSYPGHKYPANRRARVSARFLRRAAGRPASICSR